MQQTASPIIKLDSDEAVSEHKFRSSELGSQLSRSHYLKTHDISYSNLTQINI